MLDFLHCDPASISVLVKYIRHEVGTSDANIPSVGAKNTSQAVHGKLPCRSVPVDKTN